jgi:glycogen debranching enzyme
MPGVDQEAAAQLPAIDEVLSPEGWAYASSQAVDSDDPGRFHALFGRDSLIFALQVLPVRPQVAGATLRALAALQGRVEDPETEEQPGRIVHEYWPEAPEWLVAAGWPARDGRLRYYGSSDSTSWFLVLLDATRDAAVQAELAEARAGAARWLERALEDGAGFVRCGPREYPGGLQQQGWRDASTPGRDDHGGGIVREDGNPPEPPLADADSQAVAVAALDALVRLDPDQADKWAGEAAGLRARIQKVFTTDVMALEAGDVPVTGAGSQLGWLLWADALEASGAAAAVERLSAPDLLTDFGVHTLASSQLGYLPHGYHRGAIWPFDNWLVWGGLRAASADDVAARVRVGVRRAVHEIGRYPELYSVSPLGQLAPVPIANKVQAWTIGAMVAFDLDWDGRPSAS